VLGPDEPEQSPDEARPPLSARQKRPRALIILLLVAALACIGLAFGIVLGNGLREVAIGAVLIAVGLFGLAFVVLLWASQHIAPEPKPRRRRRRRSRKGKRVPLKEPVAALAPSNPAATSLEPAPRVFEARPSPAPDPAYAENAPAPASNVEAQAQPKNYVRHQPRRLDSRHAAYSLEQSGTDRFFILAGTVLGAKHDQAGITREDEVAFLIQPTAPNAIVAAVADGVSTARLSHLASALAVQHAVNLLSSWLGDAVQPGVLDSWPETAEQLVAAVANDLDEAKVRAYHAAIGAHLHAEDMMERRRGRPAATLAVVVIDETPQGAYAWWLTVGDCDVVVVDFTTGEVKWLTPKAFRDGPHTKAVPSERQATHSGQWVEIEDGQAVLVMTDGMADLLDDDEQHALKALAAAHVRGSALGDLLTALDLRLEANHDDRSLVAMGPISRK
jgi:Protein phosphatase 2C